ncbi:MAG: hypothetical protein G3M78_06080 [Candidatus Nitrohelix vancouverensis]|uniref:Uncharacterized protein n=1 Tax=Candidatus Nitrohelix vancouverensis TaxID=2705534 RepID=A0A7T0C1T6_9BACT|nr:MAG: hypothetical protein G3M78_06080 [Candidatus Nitrohelix vancouverensis]
MNDPRFAETVQLLQFVWTLLMLLLYLSGLSSAQMLADGGGENQARQEEILIMVQRLFFFGVMFVGFLIDLVRMREDRHKAYQFLLLSLVMGGLSEPISAMQWKVWSLFLPGGN